MKSLKIIIGLLLIAFINISAQGTAGTDAKFEYRSLVDLPSAGVLEKGFVGVTMDVLPAGVVISKMEVGVLIISVLEFHTAAQILSELEKLNGTNFRVLMRDSECLMKQKGHPLSL